VIRRRKRRTRKQRPARPQDMAVLSVPAREEGPTMVYGPLTSKNADSVGFMQLKLGRKVQLVPFERVLAMQEGVRRG
jgi:hypothetical protein